MEELQKYTVKCPCCDKVFTGTGQTRGEAVEEANELLQAHMDADIC